jgi:hypothetical protein
LPTNSAVASAGGLLYAYLAEYLRTRDHKHCKVSIGSADKLWTRWFLSKRGHSAQNPPMSDIFFANYAPILLASTIAGR